MLEMRWPGPGTEIYKYIYVAFRSEIIPLRDIEGRYVPFATAKSEVYRIWLEWFIHSNADTYATYDRNLFLG